MYILKMSGISLFTFNKWISINIWFLWAWFTDSHCMHSFYLLLHNEARVTLSTFWPQTDNKHWKQTNLGTHDTPLIKFLPSPASLPAYPGSFVYFPDFPSSAQLSKLLRPGHTACDPAPTLTPLSPAQFRVGHCTLQAAPTPASRSHNLCDPTPSNYLQLSPWGSVSAFTSARPASRSGTAAGSSTVSSMASPLMVRSLSSLFWITLLILGRLHAQRQDPRGWFLLHLLPGNRKRKARAQGHPRGSGAQCDWRDSHWYLQVSHVILF